MHDSIVIGGGLIGMLSALELHHAGQSVLLLERNHTGQESSWAGGGIISPLYPWRYDPAVTRLAQWGQQHYPGIIARLAETTGIDPQYQHTGLLILEPGDEAQALDWASQYKMNLSAVTPQESLKIEPELGDGKNGVWMPDIAHVRNPRAVKSLRRALELANIEIRENTPVTGFLTEHNCVTGVTTDKGPIVGKQVLVAGGAWTGALIGELGTRLDINPVRGQMILFRTRADFLKRMVLYKDRYAIPRRDGRVLMGSTMEYVGFEKATTTSARKDLRAAALELIPGLAEFEIEHHWAGLRPGKTDNVPVIAEHPEISGLYVNAGHFRNGVILGAASARLVADLMLGREPIIDPSAYGF